MVNQKSWLKFYVKSSKGAFYCGLKFLCKISKGTCDYMVKITKMASKG